mgnify:CR=1 FL=1
MAYAFEQKGHRAGIARRAAAAGLLALVLGLGAEVAAAQEWGRRGAVAGFVSAGVSGLATGELDDRLAARGYPTFGRTARSLGIGGYWILPGGVLMGGEWQGLILGTEAHEGRVVGFGGGYATLGIGYVVKLSPRVRVYVAPGCSGQTSGTSGTRPSSATIIQTSSRP